MKVISSLIGKKSIEKEVKKMRNLLVILIAMAMAFSTATPAYADFARIVDPPDRYTASVTLKPGTGEAIVPFTCELKNLSDDEAAASIAWDTVEAGSTQWLHANQYIQARGFATYDTWGIQIYTHNTSDEKDGGEFTAEPKYSGTGNPAGLVRADNTIYSLPMCWRTKVGFWKEDPEHPGDREYGYPDKTGSAAAIPHELDICQGVSDSYTVLYDGVTPHDLNPEDPDDTTLIHAPGTDDEYFPWFFMLDKATPDVDLTTPKNQEFGNYQDEATFIGSRGYHHAPGDVAANYATPSDPGDFYFIYLGANFTLAVPGKEYTTNALIVESYHL